MPNRKSLTPCFCLAARLTQIICVSKKRPRASYKQSTKPKKPIAVICHGPWLLVSTGLAKGRKLTSYHTIQDDIRNAGCNWKDEETVRDRNRIGGRSLD